MYILVTYDVQTDTPAGQRRLRKVARLCMDYGQRVQNSVFECVLSEVQLAELKHKLELAMDMVDDSIRIYYLNKNENHRITTIGKNVAINVEETLII